MFERGKYETAHTFIVCIDSTKRKKSIKIATFKEQEAMNSFANPDKKVTKCLQ